jgi:hypothetical protein
MRSRIDSSRKVGGPSRWAALALALAASASASAAARADITYNFTGTIQQYTAPTTGVYTFTVAGAQGGSNNYQAGGSGVSETGSVTLTAGTVLDIVVGGQGGSDFVDSNGGGGGSYFDASVFNTSFDALNSGDGLVTIGTTSAVPEPSSIILISLGAAGMVARALRRRKAEATA